MCRQRNNNTFLLSPFQDLLELQLCDRGICFSEDRIVPHPLCPLAAPSHLPHLLRGLHHQHLPQPPLHDGSAVSVPPSLPLPLLCVQLPICHRHPFSWSAEPFEHDVQCSVGDRWGDTTAPGPHPCQALCRLLTVSPAPTALWYPHSAGGRPLAQDGRAANS